MVADMDRTEEEELMPLVLTTLGAVETPWIGGTGILLVDVDEVPLTLGEIGGYGGEVPGPPVAEAEVFDVPETFSPPSDEPS